jgi:hypothetical protein
MVFWAKDLTNFELGPPQIGGPNRWAWHEVH